MIKTGGKSLIFKGVKKLIENYICKSCNHYMVCEKTKAILKFDEDTKKPLGVDIKIENCIDFEEIN